MFEFTEDYQVGISSIDEEHEGLFRLINEFAELLKQENVDAQVVGREMLKQLQSYACTHFRNEEAYMEKINDSELERQKKEHKAFVEYLLTYNLSDSIKTEDLEELLSYLVRWIFHHILNSDIMIGKKDDKLEFSQKYMTGISLIDEEHKKLFAIIKEADDLVHAEFLHDKYDKIMDILEELRDYTQEHFQDEEEYMKKIGYPELDKQQRAHTDFVEKLLVIDLNQLDDIDGNQQEYLERLMDFLTNWLIRHIVGSDKLIGIWERENR